MTIFGGGNQTLRWQDEDDPWIKRHGLSLAVSAVFLVQALSTIWAGHIEWIKDASDHGQVVSGWPTDFWTFWAWDYLTSIAAEPWGFLVGVLFTKWLYEQKSAESNQTDS